MKSFLVLFIFALIFPFILMGCEGEKGEAGISGISAITGPSVNQEDIDALKLIVGSKDGVDGKDGIQGAPGNDGTNGIDGKDGIDPETCTIGRRAANHPIVCPDSNSN